MLTRVLLPLVTFSLGAIVILAQLPTVVMGIAITSIVAVAWSLDKIDRKRKEYAIHQAEFRAKQEAYQRYIQVVEEVKTRSVGE